MAAPRKRSGPPAAALFAAVLAASAAGPAWSIPAVTMETHVMLHVGALLIDDGKSSPSGTPQDIEAAPEATATADLRVPLGPDGGKADVRLEATLLETPPDGDSVIRCKARVSVPGASERTAVRDVHLGEEGSSLFEVYGDANQRIVLVLSGERVLRAVVRRAAPLGEPVRFLVAIEWIDASRTVPLETNELHTFVGLPVEYSFRRAKDGGVETVRLSLLPVSISGGLITIQAEVSGALPGEGTSTLISHGERIVASLRATATVVATAGTPPAGYRFQVTPDF